MVSYIPYSTFCKPHPCNDCCLYQAFPMDRSGHRGHAFSKYCHHHLPYPTHSPTSRLEANLSDIAPRANMATVFQSWSVYNTGSCIGRPFFRDTIFKRYHDTGSGCSDPICRILLTWNCHDKNQTNQKRKAERVSPSPPFWLTVKL